VADQQQNDDSNSLTDIELERLKMYQDSFKHMMTFSSGAIVLASALTGALFPKPDFVWLLLFSIAALASGALAAMVGLARVPGYIDANRDGISAPPSWLRSCLWSSVISTYFGLAFFSAFAGANTA
jgi:hypothetical protein